MNHSSIRDTAVLHPHKASMCYQFKWAQPLFEHWQANTASVNLAAVDLLLTFSSVGGHICSIFTQTQLNCADKGISTAALMFATSGQGFTWSYIAHQWATMLCISFLISDDKKGERIILLGVIQKELGNSLVRCQTTWWGWRKDCGKKWFGFGRSFSYIMHLM